jgi:hypothetical protein
MLANELRAFLARVLGWSDERAVELALRSLALALDHRAALVLCGEGDMVPIAWALHRRTLGAGKAVHRLRSPARYESGIRAIASKPRERRCCIRGGERRLAVHAHAPVAARFLGARGKAPRRR